MSLTPGLRGGDRVVVAGPLTRWPGLGRLARLRTRWRDLGQRVGGRPAGLPYLFPIRQQTAKHSRSAATIVAPVGVSRK